MVGKKGISWGLLALAILISSEAAASSYVEATGTVSIDKTCGKTTISDMKVLVMEESPIGNSRPRWVPLDEKGAFSVLLSTSYKYRFHVKLKVEGVLHLDGIAIFDPTYPENAPVLVATCGREAEKKA